MTTRTDVIVDYLDSPRVVEVAAPSTEMTMQDLVDTLRKIEDSFQGMSYLKLLNASGKEDLGGGVSVGITVAKQNAKLAFEGRTSPAQTGTISTVPGSPITGRDSFTDAAANFIGNNVTRGSLVVNFSDRSIAEVIKAVSTTQLITKTLVNGLTNTYTALDIYHVYNIEQCIAGSGNLTAVDDGGSPIPAILPTPFTQVVLQASSSATQVAAGSALTAEQDAKLTFVNDQLTNIHNGWDHDAVMRLILGVNCGKISGPPPGQAGTVIIRDPADTKNVMEMPVDANGYRIGPAVYDPTP